MNNRDISGTIGRVKLDGKTVQRSRIAGQLSVGGHGIRELRFYASRSEFPQQGEDSLLYIDRGGQALYFWDDGEYKSSTISYEDIINDAIISQMMTWSSNKINDEFESDQQQLDNIGSFDAITNSEILQILST